MQADSASETRRSETCILAQRIVIELSLTQQMRSLGRSAGVKFTVNATVNLLNGHLLVVPEDLWVNSRGGLG